MTNENVTDVTDVTDVTATDARQGFNKEERAAFEEILEGFGDTFVLTSGLPIICLLYTSPSPRDRTRSRMPSSA